MDNNDNKEILHKISLLFREINDIRSTNYDKIKSL